MRKFYLYTVQWLFGPQKCLSTIDAPPEVSKNQILKMKLFSFCAKIAPKRHKLQKSSKLKKKCQKNPCFL